MHLIKKGEKEKAKKRDLEHKQLYIIYVKNLSHIFNYLSIDKKRFQIFSHIFSYFFNNKKRTRQLRDVFGIYTCRSTENYVTSH